MRNSPISPVRPTWVPPQSSIDQAVLPSSSPAPPIATTRTSSPYILAEQRHRALGDGGIGRHEPRGDRAVLADARIHLALDLGEVLARDRHRLAHVEAQAVGCVEAAFLRDMRAEAAAQRLVQQVGRAVMGADRRAAGVVHLRLHGLADTRLARLHGAEMHEDVAELPLRVGHSDAQPAGAGQHAGIADLAARFAVERRLVQHHRDGRARAGPIAPARR